MNSRIGDGASGAIRRFAGWVARGSVGHPLAVPLLHRRTTPGEPDIESWEAALY
ncbi:hypothetical protein [Nocardia jiangxiensis]|uniref:Uncharacterized protein n=1 Tax=Nocardia jiangxiensis TaxID=282685 RepID=A0ABW6S1Y0_9NOCA|nr:hypothetical protein [Nocardia jiangxiensis]